jgi:hypothetical protein
MSQKKSVELKLVTPKKQLFTLRVGETKKASYEFNPANRKAQEAVAKDAGVDVETVLAWSGQATVEGKVFEIDSPVSGFTSYYRGIKEPRKAPTASETAFSFLDTLAGDRETIVEWDDGNALGCLDVDYHDGNFPGREWVETTVATSLVPKPYLWHMSPRGFHAFYPAVSGLTGSEVTALAAMRWRSLDSTAGVEIKRQLRCPGAEELHKFSGYSSINSFVTDFLGVGDSTVDPSGYLESVGLEIGKRYAHNHCPIEPTAASDNRDPVVVSDAGIFCHRCSGLGRQRGRNRAGWVPYSTLCGSESSGILGTLVRRKTHWGHAKHVLDAHLGMTGDVAKLAYSAALKMFHADPEAIDGIFSPVTDSLVRLEGRWATVAEGYTFPKTIEAILKTLPATGGDPAAVCLFSQPTIDLTEWGYPSVQVIRGAKLSTRLLGTSRLVVASPAPWLKEYGSVFYPRYVEPKARMAKADARAVIETVLPGVNWDYVEVLLVARGCNEARVGLPQHLLVSGVSKSGKTSHVQLAAGILGDVVTPIEASTDGDRFRSSIRDASQKGSFLSLDEFVKTSIRLNPRLTPEQVMEPLLTFDSDSISHQLYLGPTALGHLGVCVWTDTKFAEVLHDYTQIARRVHVMKLYEQVSWDDSLAAHGIAKIHYIRTISQEYADACNAILSHVADERFGCLLTFHQICAQMGVKTLEGSDDFLDLTKRRLELFKLVSEAPALDPTDAKRWPGTGYKLIVRNGDDLLSEQWSLFSDSGKNWADAKRLHEKPFATLLGVKGHVDIDTHVHGNRMAIRFRQGPYHTPTKVNEEIVA